MFDRYEQGEKALLVHAFFSEANDDDDIAEFKELVNSANITILDVITTSRTSPSAKYLVGQGKAEEIAEAVKLYQADVILVNHHLSPAQERNLELLCKCRVVDRITLILDIFAQRARTYEGKLQVELAQLKHMSTRLVRGWTHLERQKGGIGLRGPGETQLETDRRLLRKRVTVILSRLEKVAKQREQGRQARIKNNTTTVSVVGYTNAGKSTLFNSLTNSDVYTQDQLFATLDPTVRKIELNDVGEVVLADTVGFIRNLPHDLVAAFKSTLQETKDAKLLLHVVDSSSANYLANINAVNEVLTEIEANEIPILFVMNKIDLLDNFVPRIDRDENNKPIRVWLSSLTGEGLELLKTALQELLVEHIVTFNLKISPGLSRIRSLLYESKVIEQEIINEDGSFNLRVKSPIILWNQLLKKEPSLNEYIQIM